jgi:hypothetical protein
MEPELVAVRVAAERDIVLLTFEPDTINYTVAGGAGEIRQVYLFACLVNAEASRIWIVEVVDLVKANLTVGAD